jgi:hypothetical protein
MALSGTGIGVLGRADPWYSGSVQKRGTATSICHQRKKHIFSAALQHITSRCIAKLNKISASFARQRWQSEKQRFVIWRAGWHGIGSDKTWQRRRRQQLDRRDGRGGVAGGMASLMALN